MAKCRLVVKAEITWRLAYVPLEKNLTNQPFRMILRSKVFFNFNFYMADNSILSEIQTLNLSYLMLAQRLVREEGTAAMYRLGISTEVGMKLKDMTINQLLRMSKANVLLCTFKYHDQASMLELMGSENKEEGPALIHAAILSAGNPPKVEHAL